MAGARDSVSSAVSGLFRPAVDTPPRESAVALAALRILVGLLWLYNLVWKRPPDFGQNKGKGLFGFTKDAVDHPVLAPYSWVVEHLVLPNFTAFGWTVLVAETALAVLLLIGTAVRLAALLGVVQSLAIGLSVANTPGEWPWSYWMMIGIHVALLFTAAGRVAAVDDVRSAAAEGAGAGPARKLLGGWGVVMALTAVWALAISIGDAATKSSGATIGGPKFSVSLGSYNLIGALVLLVVAVLMLTAAALRQPLLAWAATALAVLAALSLYAQLSRADVLLGGSNTTAAFFLCAAVVSGVTARELVARSRTTPPDGDRSARGVVGADGRTA